MKKSTRRSRKKSSQKAKSTDNTKSEEDQVFEEPRKEWTPLQLEQVELTKQLECYIKEFEKKLNSLSFKPSEREVVILFVMHLHPRFKRLVEPMEPSLKTWIEAADLARNHCTRISVILGCERLDNDPMFRSNEINAVLCSGYFVSSDSPSKSMYPGAESICHLLLSPTSSGEDVSQVEDTIHVDNIAPTEISHEIVSTKEELVVTSEPSSSKGAVPVKEELTTKETYSKEVSSTKEVPTIKETVSAKEASPIKESESITKDSVPEKDIIPTTKEAPSSKEAPVAKEVPVPKKSPATKELPAAKEVPTTKESPVAKEIPAAKESSAAKEVPAAKEAPVTTEVPAVKEAPTTKETSTAKEVPTTKDTPTAKEIASSSEERKTRTKVNTEKIDTTEEKKDKGKGVKEEVPSPITKSSAVQARIQQAVKNKKEKEKKGGIPPWITAVKSNGSLNSSKSICWRVPEEHAGVNLTFLELEVNGKKVKGLLAKLRWGSSAMSLDCVKKLGLDMMETDNFCISTDFGNEDTIGILKLPIVHPADPSIKSEMEIQVLPMIYGGKIDLVLGADFFYFFNPTLNIKSRAIRFLDKETPYIVSKI